MSRKRKPNAPTVIVDPREPTGAVLAAIEAIPGENGWWKHSGRDSFEAIAFRLGRYGVPAKEIVAILAEAYETVATEFGN